jgi:hypothetical protein
MIIPLSNEEHAAVVDGHAALEAPSMLNKIWE